MTSGEKGVLCSPQPNISSGAFIISSLQASEVVACVRSSPPVRHVSSRGSSVSGTYASRKMGCTIQFESHKVELWAVYTMEYDPQVLEYYDQPWSLVDIRVEQTWETKTCSKSSGRSAVQRLTRATTCAGGGAGATGLARCH
jgi:hypothetical protein